MKPLPTNEHGEINTSAAYGHEWLVVIEYYTDFDGRVIDPEKEDYPKTLHGPFVDAEEATAWIHAYPDGDTDIYEMKVSILNGVRP